MIFILSCKKENQADLSMNIINDNLIGEWTDTIEADPNGLIIYNLKINTNSTFSYKVSLFGIYSDQQNENISAWTEYIGNLEQKQDTIIFLSDKNFWWDDFYDMNPKTNQSTQILFDDCTFNLMDDTLKLTYTSYPYDAPIETIKEFIRLD
jgi:hypothetical protein